MSTHDLVGGGNAANDGLTGPEHAVEHVVEHGPETVLEPAIQEMERRIALEQAMSTTARNGLDQTQVAGLRRAMLEGQWNAFRRASLVDPPVKVKPLCSVITLDARPIKVRSHT